MDLMNSQTCAVGIKIIKTSVLATFNKSEAAFLLLSDEFNDLLTIMNNSKLFNFSHFHLSN